MESFLALVKNTSLNSSAKFFYAAVEAIMLAYNF